jgi:hypothetical protein
VAYFPNSTACDILQQQCEQCPLGEKMCPIHHVQLTHNYDQVGNPKFEAAMNLLVDAKGICQLKPLLLAKSAAKLVDPLAWLDEAAEVMG